MRLSTPQVFGTNLELRDFWHLGHVDTWIDRRATRTDWGVFVDDQGIVVQGKPVPQPRDSVAELKSGKALRRIIASGRVRVQSTHEIMPCEWQTRTDELRSKPHSEFQIGRGFKTNVEAL